MAGWLVACDCPTIGSTGASISITTSIPILILISKLSIHWVHGGRLSIRHGLPIHRKEVQDSLGQVVYTQRLLAADHAFGAPDYTLGTDQSFALEAAVEQH